jgi:hypothetical protein
MASADIDSFTEILGKKKRSGEKASEEKLKMTETHAGQMLSQSELRAGFGRLIPPICLVNATLARPFSEWPTIHPKLPAHVPCRVLGEHVTVCVV